MRGSSSPGQDRFNESLFSARFDVTTVQLFPAIPMSAGTGTNAVLSPSLSRSVVAVERHTVAELPRGAVFTTGVLPDETQHNGEINVHLLSALRGCNLSGDNARRSNGEPGSAPFGRVKPFLP